MSTTDNDVENSTRPVTGAVHRYHTEWVVGSSSPQTRVGGGSPDSSVAPTVFTATEPVAPEIPRAATKSSFVGAALAALGAMTRAAARVPTAKAGTSRRVR